MKGMIGGILLLAMAVPQGASAQATYADVAALLDRQCVLCHRGSGAPLGLALDSYDALMAGSQNGPVVVVGNPDGSELVRRIRGTSSPRMPLTGPPFLSDAEIALVVQWVQEGAKGPPAGPAAAEPTAVEPTAEVASAPTRPDGAVWFSDVAPLLASRCASCHRADGQMGAPPEGFEVTSYERLMATTDRVRVVPGQPGASELVRRIKGQSLPRMPFDGPPFLSEAEIDLVVAWVEQGARDADGQPAPMPVGARVRFEGTLTALWAVDGQPLHVSRTTRQDDRLSVGQRVEVRGIIQRGGTITVTRIRRR